MIKEFLFHPASVRLSLPNETLVKAQYEKQRAIDPHAPFPYWAKLWPAAIALSRFVAANPQMVSGKKVLELAAGLGLPSFVAAHFAQHVVCTDYQEDAVQQIQQSVAANNLKNFEAGLLDWNYLPADVSADVVLLSDVAYEPASFKTLYAVIQHFLQQGTIVILSTPQRLMTKPFAERLLPLCTQVHTDETDGVMMSIMVLSTGNHETKGF